MRLSGILFFPVTPFDEHNRVDITRLRRHVSERIDQGAAAVFAGCGTGEFHSLSTDEVLEVARASTESAEGVPVFAGVSGPVGTSHEDLKRLEDTGVSGLLVLPPPLVTGPQTGLVNYVRTIASKTSLPLIAYQRTTMVFSPESAAEISLIPNVIGIKDGVGDVAAMQGIVSEVKRVGRSDFQFFNGLPTAEISARAYETIGVSLYSSATFAFAPDIAMAFFTALRGGDDATLDYLIQEFFGPFARLRDRQLGYSVALVKAATTIGTESAGTVRAPLVDPTRQDLADLRELSQRVRANLAGA